MSLRKFILSTLCLLSIGLCGCLNSSYEKESGGLKFKQLPFKTVKDKAGNGSELLLDVFYPSGHVPGDKKPAVILFFGGGWLRGSREHFHNQARYLAGRGLVAICPDYRTEQSHGTSPATCIKDAKSAIRWVKLNSYELGIDAKKVITGGGSAGGHLAAATALIDAFNEEGEDITVSCRPEALLLFNPVVDNGPGGYGHDRVKDYWRDFSPLHNIDCDIPPTLFMLGTNDHLIPARIGREFKNKVIASGQRCELHLFEGAGHGFFNSGEDYKSTLDLVESFLVSLGYIDNT